MLFIGFRRRRWKVDRERLGDGIIVLGSDNCVQLIVYYVVYSISTVAS